MNKRGIIIGSMIMAFAITGNAQQEGHHSKERPSPEAVLKKLDANADRKLDREEVKNFKQGRMLEKFDKMDSNADNFIDLDELKAANAKRDSRKNHSPEDVLKKLDTNGDQKIDKKEAAKKERMSQNFEDIDHNKDGYIDIVELRHKKLNKERKTPEEVVEKFDTNKDQKIDKKEAATKEKFLQKFDKIDLNKDGFITAEELQQKREQHEKRKAERKSK